MSISPHIISQVFPNNTWDCQRIYNRSVYYPLFFFLFLAILNFPQLCIQVTPDDLEAKMSTFQTVVSEQPTSLIYSVIQVIWKCANMWSMAEILVGTCSQPSPGLLLSSGHRGKARLKILVYIYIYWEKICLYNIYWVFYFFLIALFLLGAFPPTLNISRPPTFRITRRSTIKKREKGSWHIYI